MFDILRLMDMFAWYLNIKEKTFWWLTNVDHNLPIIWCPFWGFKPHFCSNRWWASVVAPYHFFCGIADLRIWEGKIEKETQEFPANIFLWPYHSRYYDLWTASWLRHPSDLGFEMLLTSFRGQFRSFLSFLRSFKAITVALWHWRVSCNSSCIRRSAADKGPTLRYLSWLIAGFMLDVLGIAIICYYSYQVHGLHQLITSYN